MVKYGLEMIKNVKNVPEVALFLAHQKPLPHFLGMRHLHRPVVFLVFQFLTRWFSSRQSPFCKCLSCLSVFGSQSRFRPIFELFSEEFRPAQGRAGGPAAR